MRDITSLIGTQRFKDPIHKKNLQRTRNSPEKLIAEEFHDPIPI